MAARLPNDGSALTPAPAPAVNSPDSASCPLRELSRKSLINKSAILQKLHDEMDDAAADYKRQFDEAWSKYVDAGAKGADVLLTTRLKLLGDQAKEVAGFGVTTVVLDDEHHRSLEVAFASFAAACGAEYDAQAPANTETQLANGVPESDGLARHRHAGSLTFQSIGELTNGVDILIAKGIAITMARGEEDTLTPIRVVDRITAPEPTGHRYVLVSMMVLSTGGLGAEVELHLADIAKIRPDQQRNEFKYIAVKQPSRKTRFGVSAKVAPLAMTG